MKIKVRKAEGYVLDWLVARCEGRTDLCIDPDDGEICARDEFEYSTDCLLGVPIIEREKIGVWFRTEFDCWFSANAKWMDADPESDEFLDMTGVFRGPTLLIAAMRCYVTSKLGEEVEVPDELVEYQS